MALSDDLVALWPLDEASGDAIDAVGSNDLSEINTVGTGTGLISGNARVFSSPNYFSRADNTDLSTGDIDFTVAFWTNISSYGGGYPIAASKGWGGGSAEWVIFQFDDDGNKITFALPGVDVRSASLSLHTWYHVVAWHDSVGNQIGISLNAGTPYTASHSGGTTDGTDTFTIGRSSNQAQYWQGRIEQFGFWKRVLTSQDRTDLYNGGAGLAYPFGGGGGDPIVVGNGLIRGSKLNRLSLVG